MLILPFVWHSLLWFTREQILKANQVVVREVCVGENAKSLADVLRDELPCLVRAGAAHDAGQRPVAAAAERRLLAESQDLEPLEVLVLDAAPIDPACLAVLLLGMTSGILPVDVDFTVEPHARPPRRHGLAHFPQQYAGGLELAAPLAGELKRALALHRISGHHTAASMSWKHVFRASSWGRGHVIVVVKSSTASRKNSSAWGKVVADAKQAMDLAVAEITAAFFNSGFLNADILWNRVPLYWLSFPRDQGLQPPL